MQTMTKKVERFTISLPGNLSIGIDEVRKELNIPKSEVFRLAVEKFLQQHQKDKLRKIAEMMAAEYETNDELTVLTSLDAEGFK